MIDDRTPVAYAKRHVPSVINLWHRTINAETTTGLPKNKVLVTYLAGVYCNASAKAAARLAALSFQVKEMLDGMEGWKQEGYSTDTGGAPATVWAPAVA